MHNKVFLAKWLWRFGIKRYSLWRIVVAARFGKESVWESRRVRGRHDCGIWKSIMARIEEFSKHIRFKLGSEKNIKF